MTGSYNQRIKQSAEKRFRFVFLLLKLVGFPINSNKTSLPQLICNSTFGLCAYSTNLAMLAHIYVHSDDLKLTMRTVRMYLMSFITIWMEINYRFRRDVITHLFLLTESFTWEEMPKVDKDGKVTMAGLMLQIQNTGRKIMYFFYGFHIIQSTIIIITIRELIYPAWYYFDVSTSPTYELILLIQFLASFRIGTIFLITPYLYALLVCIACTQLEKLRGSLLNLKQKHTKAVTDPEDEYQTNVHEARRLQSELSVIIRHHQEIISYIHTLQDMLSVMLFGVFFIFLLTSCSASFSAVMSLEDVPDFSQCVAIYMLVIIGTSIFCGFGTLLSEEYEAMKNAAWSSDWIGSPVPYQRCILFIMSVSNKGLNFMAGKIVPVTNSTLMGMLNESMSLFMFLLTMKDKSEKSSLEK